MHLFLQHARHQPFAALARQLIQGIQRHAQRHAIAHAARLEVIRQAHFQARHGHGFREQVGGHAGRLVAHQLFAVQIQQLGVLARRFLVPFFETGAIAHVRRQQLVVEGGDQFIVDQHVQAARLVFEVLDILDQLVVVRKEWRARVEVAADEGVANKNFARFRQIEIAVIDAALAVHHQAI